MRNYRVAISLKHFNSMLCMMPNPLHRGWYGWMFRIFCLWMRNNKIGIWTYSTLLNNSAYRRDRGVWACMYCLACKFVVQHQSYRVYISTRTIWRMQSFRPSTIKTSENRNNFHLQIASTNCNLCVRMNFIRRIFALRQNRNCFVRLESKPHRLQRLIAKRLSNSIEFQQQIVMAFPLKHY